MELMYHKCLLTGYIILMCFELTHTANVLFYKNSKGYVEVPDDIPKDVTHIQLILSKISEFPPEKLFNRTRLVSLHMGSNLLTTFPNLTYVANTITHLTLNKNRITTVAYELLDMLIRLVYLDLNYNQLSMFPNAQGPGMTLQRLYLGVNKLTNLTSYHYVGHSLSTFYINSNQLTKVDPEIFRNMSYLYDLHLGSNQLTEFPNVTRVAATLNVLRLEYNKIENVSYEVLDEMKKLRHIQLQNNKLQDFPNPSGLNQVLAYLDLSVNSLMTTPDLSIVGAKISNLKLVQTQLNLTTADDFRGLNSLAYLYISSNKISNFPNLTLIANTLRILEIHTNKITFIPSELLDMLTKLQRFQISKNLLSTFPDVAGPSNTLTELYLSNNQFTIVPVLNTIGVKLTHFHMQANLLTAIKVQNIIKLQSLLRIAFGYNQFVSFPDIRAISARLTHAYFHEMPSMTSLPPDHLNFHNNTKKLHIYFYRTKIETVPPVMFGPLLYMDLRWTPLICDNSLVWAVRNPGVSMAVYCVKPTYLKGRAYNLLKLSDIAASKNFEGTVEDEEILHDGLPETCTKILPVRIKRRTVCSPVPSNLILKLQGEFGLVAEFTTRISVVYYGGNSCYSDVFVYYDPDTQSTCKVSEAESDWLINECPLISDEKINTGASKCTFECEKSLNMYISFLDKMINGTVCDISYVKATIV